MATQQIGAGPETDRLQSVRRALAVLEALAMQPGGATPKELSRDLAIHLSTCYRLLHTLAEAGYIARDPEGHFRLGSRVAFLHNGYLAALKPPPEALPFLHALQLATGETVILSHLEGDLAVSSAVITGSRPGAIPPGYVGFASPAHAIAAGRVLLAHLPTSRLEAYLARQAAEIALPFPLTNPDALRSELQRIRQQGYAIDRGQYAIDYGRGETSLCCIAAPVVGDPGAIEASLAIAMPRARFQREEPAMIAAILAVVGAIGALQSAPAPCEIGTGVDEQEPGIKAALAAISEAMSRVR